MYKYTEEEMTALEEWKERFNTLLEELRKRPGSRQLVRDADVTNGDIAAFAGYVNRMCQFKINVGRLESSNSDIDSILQLSDVLSYAEMMRCISGENWMEKEIIDAARILWNLTVDQPFLKTPTVEKFGEGLGFIEKNSMEQ